MGRGSLEGGCAPCLPKEYVNRHRSQARVVSLDEQSEAGVQVAAPAADPTPAIDPRLEPAIDAALGALPAEDRWLLVSYYLDGQTLAQIGRVLRVHESTISRRMERLVQAVRGSIVKRLRAQGMSRRQAEETLEADVRDLAVDVRGRLRASAGTTTSFAQEGSATSFSKQDTS